MARHIVNFEIWNDEGDLIMQRIITFPEDYYTKFKSFKDFKKDIQKQIDKSFSEKVTTTWNEKQISEFADKFGGK
jgi:hypothetical protein